MQVQIVSGIYSDNTADFRTSYPRNFYIVPKATGISNGYLLPSEGIELFASGLGSDRGAINWLESCYRVSGSRLINVSSSGYVTDIDDVEIDSNYVSMDYSDSYLAIASNKKLFLYDGSTVTQVTDSDLGVVNDVVYIDGYFMTTDGKYLVVGDLGNPFSINPLKYGTSEADPDSVKGLLKINNELSVINRYTIEAFQNVGGDLFPFQRIAGAQIDRGAIGKDACCVYENSIAFIGGGKNESIGVYIGLNGSSKKISTREIDIELEKYDVSNYNSIKCEERGFKNHKFLYIHLSDKTFVYDAYASQSLGSPAWCILTSSKEDTGRYRAVNFVYCYGLWICGDPTSDKIGKLINTKSTQFGADISWDFSTPMLYNESNGVIIKSLELVGLPGRVDLGDDPIISNSYSVDGQSWSQNKYINSGKQGNLTKRLVWFTKMFFRNYCIQRFNGYSDSHISFARLEADMEALYG